jgi:N-acetylglucosamine-6-phosphate deacetylase
MNWMTWRRGCVAVAALFAMALAWAGPPLVADDAPSTAPVDGLRTNTPRAYALVDARIVKAPGAILEKGTVVVRDGAIVAVGADVKPPADARVIPAAGKTIYAGLIDGFSEIDTPAPGDGGAKHWNADVAPQVSAAAIYKTSEATNRTLRSQGIAARIVVPDAGLIKGTAALVTTADVAGSQAILKSDIAMQAKLQVPRVSRAGGNVPTYPSSPMGALTLVRQTLYDAAWYQAAWKAYESDHRLPRPERNDALAALESVVAGRMPMIIEASNELYFLRADRVAREFALRAIVRGSGHEYERLDAIAATGRAVLLPVAFPKAPDVATNEAAANASLDRLMHWDLAPENPGRLDKAGVKIALCTFGLKDAGSFLKAVRRAVHRGLDRDAALRALTTTPAALFGVDDRLGTVEAGKSANLIVTDGDLFADKTKILETWVDGQPYAVASVPMVDVHGTWEFAFETAGAAPQTAKLQIAGDDKLTGELVVGEKHVDAKFVALHDSRLAVAFAADLLGKPGIARASGVVTLAGEAATIGPGTGLWPDGSPLTFTARRVSADVPKVEPPTAPDPSKPGNKPDKKDEKKDDGAKNVPEKAASTVNYPLGAYGRTAPPEQPRVVLLKNATVWTCGPKGTLANASIVVREGKIEAVGADLPTPEGASVIDLGGKHVSPGIIDCHSHIATDGGINEATQAITAEVRIGDFIDSSDINIYRQLAGGVTSSNILHGSANPIGGQNQIIKMRWGALPEDMKFPNAPLGIKFALGENVKQSNWGDNFRTRYPQSRMGVEQIMRDEFLAARQYRDRQLEWKRDHAGIPPRTDLELEAVVEILEGKRSIHCHCYRQDEILALLRVCEEFHVRIGTLQHVLEGYKIADQIARHGAGGSSFSDWWAYKFEVIDAIPYNGALMYRAGIVTSFNSDDAELGRRLNWEAAKAMKYGAVPADEAIKFVTLNPAKQLKIDGRVGSIEPGKDADLAVWSGSPLSSLAHCEQTWIDGCKYFDRADETALRQRDAQTRNAIVQRILTTGANMLQPGEPDDAAEAQYDRTDIYCGCQQGVRQ